MLFRRRSSPTAGNADFGGARGKKNTASETLYTGSNTVMSGWTHSLTLIVAPKLRLPSRRLSHPPDATLRRRRHVGGYPLELLEASQGLQGELNS
jgi:hypothetical protein